MSLLSWASSGVSSAMGVLVSHPWEGDVRRARHAARASLTSPHLTAPVPGCAADLLRRRGETAETRRGADASCSSLHCDAHQLASERSPRFLRALNPLTPLNPRLPDKADGERGRGAEGVQRGAEGQDRSRVC